VRAITQENFRFERKKFLHLIPFALCVIWIAVFNINSLALLQFRAPDTSLIDNLIVDCLWVVVKVVPVAYAVAAYRCVRQYRVRLENQYSNFSPTEPGWLFILTLGFLGSWAITLFVHIFAEFSNAFIADIFGIVDNYLGFILLNALFMYSVVYAHQMLVTKPEPEPVKEKSDDKIGAASISKVQQGMEVHKLYLKHNLNIEEFSKRIDLPIKDVSAVINKHYNTNFFEFMNTYRVEEAKRLLLDEKWAEMTVLYILLQAGFNSKSAFHRFFNRLVGLSPTEFRKQALQQKVNS
jgi:AraC-like DNA-binding protein